VSAVPGVRRIAVLRANAVGDYVMALPALDALRAAYPDAEIVLVGAPWHADFLADRPCPVDEVVVLPEVVGMGGVQPDAPPADLLPGVLAGLRARDFDLAVQLHGGGAQSNPVVRDFGARCAVGLQAPGAEPLDRCVPYRYYQPEVSRCLEVVALAGATRLAADARLAVTAADVAEAAAAVPDVGGPDAGGLDGGGPDAGGPPPLVALHPGATDDRRRWPSERFAALAAALVAGGAQVVVTGSAGEQELVDAVVSGAGAPVRGLAGALGLGGLVGLYSRCALVVSNDTGPRHLAQAVGTPTVGLFWCGNAINAAPHSRSRHRVLLSWMLHCPICGADCSRDLYPHRAGEGCTHRPSFLADIPLPEVLEECHDLLATTSPSPLMET
jgi:ADP-heptose:LPS heptosyltransferase